ncbi:hypothetical protein H257_04377 [Aphanomyces astaci]|uniref:Uncharacterized protein n=1 Tax=Aphanomyces astaci TaxID=112090 RepID=W4GVI2_APHAT|nr:hypothetical protein H257_04377 [Aphanomyces astaci]ETV83725.1 hypothetical protein H257_04377 [Aphanomyces astaci]|eukprot:XP_009827155.1 hypothetical protein H257_04377 [Aphanomyces astaci]
MHHVLVTGHVQHMHYSHRGQMGRAERQGSLAAFHVDELVKHGFFLQCLDGVVLVIDELDVTRHTAAFHVQQFAQFMCVALPVVEDLNFTRRNQGLRNGITIDALLHVDAHKVIALAPW